MKKLEIIIKPEKLEDLKGILDSCGAHGLMISNIMGSGLTNRNRIINEVFSQYKLFSGRHHRLAVVSFLFFCYSG